MTERAAQFSITMAQLNPTVGDVEGNAATARAARNQAQADGADLVVLSGCETALGQQVRGEGLVGLTQGFFYAGARRVVASLWRVEDRSTEALMVRFYRGLLVEGLPPAAALRAAQLAIRRTPQWREPYHWAPFILEGDWLPAPHAITVSPAADKG